MATCHKAADGPSAPCKFVKKDEEIMGPPPGDWGEGGGPKGLSVRPEDPDDALYVSVTKSVGAPSWER
jgi:hypothetical protein